MTIRRKVMPLMAYSAVVVRVDQLARACPGRVAVERDAIGVLPGRHARNVLLHAGRQDHDAVAMRKEDAEAADIGRGGGAAEQWPFWRRRGGGGRGRGAEAKGRPE